MTITIDVPENLVQEACSRGIAVEALVRETLQKSPLARIPAPTRSSISDEPEIRPGFTRFSPGLKTVDQAAHSLLERRERHRPWRCHHPAAD